MSFLRLSLFPSQFIWWAIHYSIVCCSILKSFCMSYNFSYYWVLVFSIAVKYKKWFQLFHLLRFALCSIILSLLRNFYGWWKDCVLPFGCNFLQMILDPFDLYCHLTWIYFFLICLFCSDGMSFWWDFIAEVMHLCCVEVNLCPNV